MVGVVLLFEGVGVVVLEGIIILVDDLITRWRVMIDPHWQV